MVQPPSYDRYRLYSAYSAKSIMDSSRHHGFEECIICQDLREVTSEFEFSGLCTVEGQRCASDETDLATAETNKVRFHRNLPKFGPGLKR